MKRDMLSIDTESSDEMTVDSKPQQTPGLRYLQRCRRACANHTQGDRDGDLSIDVNQRWGHAFRMQPELETVKGEVR